MILETLKTKARAIKQDIHALMIASKRKDVPWYAKALIVVVVAYAMSPIDLIPDFIPVLGYLDDIILIPLGITLAIRLIPASVLAECRILAERESVSKRKNWIAGACIVCIWMVFGLLLVKAMFF